MIRLTAAASIITNLAGGTFDITFDGQVQQVNSPGVLTFWNNGLFRKTGGAATADLGNTVFNNSGSVEVQSGTLRLGNGGTSTGSFLVPLGKTLELGGGTHNLNAGSSLIGAGNLLFSGAANIGGTDTITGTHTFSGGIVTFGASVDGTALTGPLAFSNGTARRNFLSRFLDVIQEFCSHRSSILNQLILILTTNIPH